jgi:uncharacterized damage-inducible protein DinB
MPVNPEYVTQSIEGAFEGKHAHPPPSHVLSGLDKALAGSKLEGFPHTIHQLVQHLVFWQDLGLDWIQRTEPPGDPDATGDWSAAAAPADDDAWSEMLERFSGGLASAKRLAATESLEVAIPGWDHVSRLDILQTIASHNSFHLGQVVSMRRLLGAWPPPEK